MALNLTLNTVGKVVHTEIAARLREISSAGGGTLSINGTHLLAATAGATGLRWVNIDFGGTGKLVLGKGVAKPALDLRGTAADTVRLFRPRIDVSAGTYVIGTQSNTALALWNFGKAEVYDPWLYGGPDWENASGDSGITATSVVRGYVDGGRVQGFADLGFYISGDANATLVPTQNFLIQNVWIEGCHGAVSSKRGYNKVKVANCKLVRNFNGIRTDWIIPGPTEPKMLPPGRNMVVSDVKIYNTERTAIVAPGPTVFDVQDVKIINAHTGVWNRGCQGCDFKRLSLVDVDIGFRTETWEGSDGENRHPKNNDYTFTAKHVDKVLSNNKKHDRSTYKKA